MRTLTPLLAFALLGASLAPAFAQDAAPAKRAEGRYWVELAEILLKTEDFDVLVGTVDEAGPRAGAPAQDIVSELSSPHLEAPMITLGLNRPSGKSSFALSVFDFDMKDQRFPQNFEEDAFVVRSTLLPAGVAFQRQAQPPASVGSIDDDFVPNFGNEFGYQGILDFKTATFTFEHNIYENERFRLRWTGGLRYAQIEEQLGAAISNHPEAGRDAAVFTRNIDFDFGGENFGPAGIQDFFFVISRTGTRGLGPKLGLDARFLAGEKKKWSFEAAFDVALLPESTTADYLMSFTDASPELRRITGVDMDGNPIVLATIPVFERPVIPGVAVPGSIGQHRNFAATESQSDFTEETYFLSGRLGFRWAANDMFTIGLDLWQMRWTNLLSNIGVVKTINQQATFEARPGNPIAPDPNLRVSDDLIRVPRFSERHDAVFDGVGLHLGFQF